MQHIINKQDKKMERYVAFMEQKEHIFLKSILHKSDIHICFNDPQNTSGSHNKIRSLTLCITIKHWRTTAVLRKKAGIITRPDFKLYLWYDTCDDFSGVPIFQAYQFMEASTEISTKRL